MRNFSLFNLTSYANPSLAFWLYFLFASQEKKLFIFPQKLYIQDGPFPLSESVGGKFSLNVYPCLEHKGGLR